jgi:hypothetical protein
MEYEYKIIDVADDVFSSALGLEGSIDPQVLQAHINKMAAEGWRLLFMINVKQRLLVISKRETLMLTFERKVLEKDRIDRMGKCNNDLIEAIGKNNPKTGEVIKGGSDFSFT